jgi:hypothetical protein
MGRVRGFLLRVSESTYLIALLARLQPFLPVQLTDPHLHPLAIELDLHHEPPAPHPPGRHRHPAVAPVSQLRLGGLAGNHILGEGAAVLAQNRSALTGVGETTRGSVWGPGGVADGTGTR